MGRRLPLSESSEDTMKSFDERFLEWYEAEFRTKFKAQLDAELAELVRDGVFMTGESPKVECSGRLSPR